MLSTCSNRFGAGASYRFGIRSIQQFVVIGRMPAPDGVRFSAFEELAGRVGAGGVEQAIARDIAKGGRDERFRYEASKGAGGPVLVQVNVGRDGASRFKRERACENREPAQDNAFVS